MLWGGRGMLVGEGEGGGYLLVDCGELAEVC